MALDVHVPLTRAVAHNLSSKLDLSLCAFLDFAFRYASSRCTFSRLNETS